ncbi:Mor transcription activator family protein [Xenorhabdus ehlersii]|uniref:Mor transcription activator family protein n=1 Tax=Xenorhabdus ehlersii TaxID=290111 RepID=A0A2D0IL70_9GAMM|nr:Mor transcription activator family protein [Xenorhabdus ehlersii]PHM22553.1 mor transcription activator family protein [Xenorhabdus ehlersii]RKE91429.1 Mor transcription activator family protein [Xenorhabdus ehlersii]
MAKEPIALEHIQPLLPESLRHIASLIGYPATLKLIDVFGGTTFPFGRGKHPRGQHRQAMLVAAIGEEAAACLSQHFAGTELYIPNAAAAMREWRNQRFLSEFNQLLNEGNSALMAISKLCPIFGFSDRHAWSLLSRYKHSGTLNHQCDLF